MGLIFQKRFTYGHNLLRAEAPLSPPHTILDKAIYRVVYWWAAFISTVIKRKDYTYAATSPPHLTILMKAILWVCILMGLIFQKRFTYGHNLLRAEAPLSPPHTILDKAIYRVVYWWAAFISTVIKRKDYTYAATSPPHLTILMKAILWVCILMGLIFQKRFTNRHNLLRADLRAVWRHEIGCAC